MQMLNVTLVPIYLPADTAEVPFGDPLSGVTATAAAPGVFTVPGYGAPVVNQAVSFSSVGGSVPAPLVQGTTYYVQAVTVTNAVATFTVSATKGGAAITTSTVGSGAITAHLLSQQPYGPLCPFKPTGTAIVLNLSGGSLTLQGTSDLNATSGVYGNPGGPNTGAYATIAVVAAGTAALCQLNFDWIRVSTAGTLVLLQN